MAQFIHLFDERNLSSIRRNGIKKSKYGWGNIIGVYAFPQTENFVVNHQWMRELRRRNHPNLLAARIRISDSELVYIGKYNEEHLEVTAAEAVGISRRHTDPLGLEVIIPKPILPKQVGSIYKPPKVSGWRYYPGSRGVKPCGCPYCQRGEPFNRRIRERYENT